MSQSEPAVGSESPAAARARGIVERLGDPKQAQVAGATYRVTEVTWPVSAAEDGSGAFASPHAALALIRDDAVLADVRADYWDGSTWYRVVGDRLGRWMRFRIGSPGDRGWDLHLATEEEQATFARDAVAVAEAFGLSG